MGVAWDDALFRLPSLSELPLDVQLLTPELAAAFSLPYVDLACGPSAGGSASAAMLPSLQHQISLLQPSALQAQLQSSMPMLPQTPGLAKLTAGLDTRESEPSTSAPVP